MKKMEGLTKAVKESLSNYIIDFKVDVKVESISSDDEEHASSFEESQDTNVDRIEGENKHMCVMCKHRFSTLNDLKLHASIHIIFDDSGSGTVGIESQIFNNEFTITCQDCQEQFTEINEYEEHFCLAIFRCEICEDNFLSADDLKDHVCIKTFSCHNCQKSFDNSYKLTEHTCIRLLICTLCHCSFFNVTDLNKHKCIEKNETDAKELDDNFNFNKIKLNNYCRNVPKHIVEWIVGLNPKVLLEDYVKPFVCSVCDRKFSVKGMLNNHNFLVHKMKRKTGRPVKVRRGRPPLRNHKNNTKESRRRVKKVF